MPTLRLPDDTPVVQFDALLEVSPFALFRRLREGRGPRLLDARPPGGARTLAGAERLPSDSWEPEATDADILLFDDDGSLAVPQARRLQAAGFERVRALFGGLDHYEFALDPQVVGEETFLVDAAPPGGG